MTADPSQRRLLSPLGVRLAAAFITVAIAAITVLGVLSVVAARGEVSGLVADIHADDARSTAAAASRAYEAAGGWDGADLSAAAAVAARGQATLAVADADGALIAAPADEAAEMMTRMHGVEILDASRADPVTEPVVVDGDRVGTVALRFPSSHLPTPERQARDALARTILLGGLLAVAVAVVVAVYVARRLAAPVNALTSAAVAMGTGHRQVRVNQPDALGELGVLSVAFDQMAESVERQDQLRRQLVADVAHEVRTPLTILRATTEGLTDGVIAPDEATLQSLHDEVLRLGGLIADLETLAAADAASLELRCEAIDLADVVTGVVDGLRATATDQAVSIHAELQAAPTNADPRRVQQILTNVVVNGLRYTPPGGRITVRTGQTADRQSFVTVTDDGPGLSEEDIIHVFDRFYRGSAAKELPGSGIGLAIANELALAHGGELTAANSARGGAVFTLTVPADRSD